MDVRKLPSDLDAAGRVAERRARIEEELGVDLSAMKIAEKQLGSADEKNCEQMYGAVPLPVGLAGPLTVHFSSGEERVIFLPLATTEGALVASVNRGCKALTQAGGVRILGVTHHGTTRSIAFKRSATSDQRPALQEKIEQTESEWKSVAEATSGHLTILFYTIDTKDDHLFLTIAADTDEAMGMNMVTIAAQAVGEWIQANIGGQFVTVAGNVDSDKKPSKRTYEQGRGYEVRAEATVPAKVIEAILKSDPEALLEVAHAKLELGSTLAGAYGRNLHAANVIAALYLATGQDAAHVVEGSMADTRVDRVGVSTFAPRASHFATLGASRDRSVDRGVGVGVRIPALMVGVRGGGTMLPAQKQNLELLLKEKTSLHPRQQLAESIAAAVLAGEVSLLAAQATHTLARAHAKMAR